MCISSTNTSQENNKGEIFVINNNRSLSSSNVHTTLLIINSKMILQDNTFIIKDNLPPSQYVPIILFMSFLIMKLQDNF